MQEGPELFDAGRIIGPEGPHGIVVRAAVVSDAFRADMGASVAIKIVPVGDRLTATLQATVRQIMGDIQHAALVKYHGVWRGPTGEAWIVSDLCENRSVPDVLREAEIVDVSTLERITAYVVRNVLLVVDALHASSHVHGDVRCPLSGSAVQPLSPGT